MGISDVLQNRPKGSEGYFSRQEVESTGLPFWIGSRWIGEEKLFDGCRMLTNQGHVISVVPLRLVNNQLHSGGVTFAGTAPHRMKKKESRSAIPFRTNDLLTVFTP